MSDLQISAAPVATTATATKAVETSSRQGIGTPTDATGTGNPAQDFIDAGCVDTPPTTSTDNYVDHVDLESDLVVDDSTSSDSTSTSSTSTSVPDVVDLELDVVDLDRRCRTSSTSTSTSSTSTTVPESSTSSSSSTTVVDGAGVVDFELVVVDHRRRCRTSSTDLVVVDLDVGAGRRRPSTLRRRRPRRRCRDVVHLELRSSSTSTTVLDVVRLDASSTTTSPVRPSTTDPDVPVSPPAVLTGNAVCNVESGETTLTWIVRNNTGSATNISGDTRGLTFDPNPVPANGTSTATETLDGPVADEADHRDGHG